MPKVSVLLPLYNAEKYVVSALETILDQTYQDFEVLILNDGSTDQSIPLIEELITERSEKRVKIIHNDQNRGTSYTLNRGIDLAEGDFLARMDADDLCMLDRLEKQVQFLEQHPDVDMVGTAFKTFGKTVPKFIQNPATDPEIKVALLFDCAMTLVMIRKKRMQEFSLHYDPADAKAEDYELWTRCALHFKLANLMEPLFLYRFHPEQASKAKQEAMGLRADHAREVYLKKLNISLDSPALKTHHALSRNQFTLSLKELEHWKHSLNEQVMAQQPSLYSGLNPQLQLRFTRAYFENYFDSQLKRWIVQEKLYAPQMVGMRKRLFYIAKAAYRMVQSTS